MSKNIIITGASRGIGFALATQLSEDGHQVLALSRNLNSLQQKALNNVHCLSCDIAKE